VHGTVATVSDPHEIANVLGVEGVDFMIRNGMKVPFQFHFGAPSCVPATQFETSGAVIDAAGIRELMASPEIYYLAEMMNYPGVLSGDPEVFQKIKIARDYGKPVDGHAPGLRGDACRRYCKAGISTDHECSGLEEAREKLGLGMKILIREGSAARNFDALIDLMPDHADQMMFCSDDKHPNDLVRGHINQLCARAVSRGIDVFNVLQAACTNPVHHYNMNVGLLREGDAADFIRVENLEDFVVLQTYINGELVAEKGKSRIGPVPFASPNNFNIRERQVEDFFRAGTAGEIKVIEALDGELLTNEVKATALLLNGGLVSDLHNDILKISVVNRYTNCAPAIGFIKNFGLSRGAIASSVAHDSHNIIAVGVSDEMICRAVNLLIANRGGICAVDEESQQCLPLPVAGIMSVLDGWETAREYETLDAMAKSMGSPLSAPYMTLSFMALLVIPDLKLSDQGLFSGREFHFSELQD
jgi:adenine deaminase